MNRNRLKQIIFSGFILLSFCFTINTASAQVKMQEEEWDLPIYKIGAPDKNPMFFKNEVYQGASKYIYPYKLNDVILNERDSLSHLKILTLENEYIRLAIAPEIGGKIYYGTDKTNGYNFFYKNNVVKPANIGMTGAWVSGGIEWCVVHHHRASTYLPINYKMVKNQDGSKTIWIGETELRHQMRWTIGITVFPGKSYYQTEVKVHNRTPFPNSFLYWANAAVHVNENYQTIFPTSVDYAMYHAKNCFAHWPNAKEVFNHGDFTNGVDISWWNNVTQSNSFFAYDIKEDFMGGYDHGKQVGTVHVGNHHILKGAKVWEWGSGLSGQATEAKLTEKDGPYAELMVGAFSDNQPDYSWIQPYEVKTFKQYWYPVKDIQGFKNANLNGAVNLERKTNNQVFIGYYSTQVIENAKVVVKNKDEVIFEKQIHISPEQSFTETIKINGPFDETDLFTELINSDTNKTLVSYQQIKKEYIKELPEIVQQPDAPANIPTIEQLYLIGQRIQQFYNPTLNAMDYYSEALNRDPSDIRTNIAIGRILLKNGDYLSARQSFSKAIKRLTKDYTRPLDCEALYLQGLTLKALGMHNAAIDTLYRATWDYAYHAAAYLELAKISCQQGNLMKALEQVNKSLSTNGRNNSAINLKASILRKLGRNEEAIAILAPLIEKDPLDLRGGYERFLSTQNLSHTAEAANLLATWKKAMRDFDENYLELAAEYIDDGLIQEAKEILSHFIGNNPLINYYLGYISDKQGNKTSAASFFKAGSAQSVDYCFPFRLETINVLNKALEYNSKDAKACYYLGNLLFDKQPEKAIENWEKTIAYEPTLAIAHRNLGWGYYRFEKNVPKAIEAYEKALSLNNSDPIYYAEIDPLYELANAPIEKRLGVFNSNHEVAKLRDDSSVREIKVLTLAGKGEKAVEYIEGNTYGYREGSSAVRNITTDGYIIYGLNLMNENDYERALEAFSKANIIKEDAMDDNQTGDMRTPQVEYYIALANEKLGDKAAADSFYNDAVNRRIYDDRFVGYYQALSYIKLGEKNKAKTVFNKLIGNGNKALSDASNVNFFAKFGERDSENKRKSEAYLLKGLGYKGLGRHKLAEENLYKALELWNSNLWALIELK